MLIGARDVSSMTAKQREVYDRIASGPRKDVPWPFLAMLDAPHLADAIQGVGAAIRFSGELTAELREVAILATAAAFGSGYEWDYHLAIARDLHLPESTIEAARTGKADMAASAEDRLTITLCRQAVLEHRVDQETLGKLVPLVGRSAASEIVAISGYYPLLALFLSAGALDRSELS